MLITEEDEKFIRDIANDINEKAFYGKILKKVKNESSRRENKENLEDREFGNLSPRSKEIAQVMKIIQNSDANK